MTKITIYRTSMTCIPARGVRDEQGAIRVGAAGGWEFSRVLSEQGAAGTSAGQFGTIRDGTAT